MQKHQLMGETNIEFHEDEAINQESKDDDYEMETKTDKWNLGSSIGIRSDSMASVENIKELRLRKAPERRMVDKEGKLRVVHRGLKQQKSRFIDDIFTTCVEMRWRYIVLAFISGFITSWLAFAGLWHLMFWLHGDLEEEHLPDNQESSGWTPCVYSIYDFSSTFLYSVETQHTIGYGLRGSSHKCPDTIIVQCIQSILGVAIQACMAGIVFAKLARPKKRAKTFNFSKNAVISLVNGKLRLMIRVANYRNSLLLESHFRADLLGNIITREGNTFRHYSTDLAVSTQLDQEDIDEPQVHASLFLPTIISHVIDSSSPLYDLSPAELSHSKIEIIVTLEGIVEPSGNTTQVRTSYLPSEILWGHSFVNCVTWVHKDAGYLVDHSKLDEVFPDETPRVSGRRLDTIYTSYSSKEKSPPCTCNNTAKGEGKAPPAT